MAELPLLIPRVLHQIWLGPKPFPEQFACYRQSWIDLNPGWELRIWTDDNLPNMENSEFFYQARTYSEKSDILRHELLRDFGGIYIDTDFECLKPIEELLIGVSAFAACERDDLISVGILGAIPEHPAFVTSVRALGTPPFPRHHAANHNTGPAYLTEVWKKEGMDQSLVLFPASIMYPLGFDERRPCTNPTSEFPDAYAIHHWAHSWA